MDDLVLGFYLDDEEDIVKKLPVYLVHGECHLINVKDSNFGALGKKYYSLMVIDNNGHGTYM